MKRSGQTDHLSSSLTDLMTSLMVIFVLLLVTKLNNQASAVTSAVNRVLKELKAHAQSLGDNENIYAQGDVIVIVIPDELMSFQQGSAQQGGRSYRVRAANTSSGMCQDGQRCSAIPTCAGILTQSSWKDTRTADRLEMLIPK